MRLNRYAAVLTLAGALTGSGFAQSATADTTDAKAQLKQNEDAQKQSAKAHKAQEKADKQQRKALSTKAQKKADKDQDKATAERDRTANP